ncbi:MAG: SLC13 family permease [Rhizobiales bacterium 65-9]|mgnify:CR=1 FL=1|nr:MAG: SLC13 family permease [Rhizobiales bacterium 65-9]
MTSPQLLAIAVIVLMMAAFIWGRYRYDVVAGAALVLAVAVGVVPAKEAFKGFSDDIVIIVGSALIVSAAVGRSGVLEAGLRLAAPYLRSVQSQVVALTLFVTVLSAVVKNIGALAMALPLALQIARRGKTSPSVFLMPMSFGALLGGIVTLIGTSPNIIVARVREELTGAPFQMFDFTPVGLVIAIVGVAFLSVGYRLLPKDRKSGGSLEDALDIKDYVTEVEIGEDSKYVGQPLSDLMQQADDEVSISAVIRAQDRRALPLPDARLHAGDILILRGEQAALDRFVKAANLFQEGDDRPVVAQDEIEGVISVEAVIGPASSLIGQSPGGLQLHTLHHVNLIAVSRSGERIRQRLRDVTLRAGDVIVLKGVEANLPDTLRALGALPLASRQVALGGVRRQGLAVAILAVTILSVALNLVPVAIAFFAAAGLLIATGALPLREAYASVEWPILVMLGALIPVSDALRTTGATDVMAAWLSSIASGLPAWGALTLILVAAMAVTPFLNNAATVLVMAPIAAGLAKALGYNPDAFLMAVAIGAACDFLTPIGHQCNTLVMGPGGYKFGDYARLGAPLSLLIIVVGVPAILIFWPLHG